MVHEGRHIPNRLRKHRMMKGFKQQDVAKLLGHKSTCRISRWEKGLSMPSATNLIKLHILYGTLIEELYFDYVYLHKKQFITKNDSIQKLNKKIR